MRFYGDPIKSSSTGRDLDETKFANATLASSSRLLQFVFTILVPITFVTLSGCDRQSRSGNLETAKKTQAAPPAEVSVVTISPKTLPVKFEAVGQTEGSREVEVRARVVESCCGAIISEGAFVKQGTLLFKIDPAPYQAALNKVKGILEQEEAQLENVKRDEERLRPLFAENAVSRKDLLVPSRECGMARIRSMGN
jgi:membrane fusion protein, multidrug efflux system